MIEESNYLVQWSWLIHCDIPGCTNTQHVISEALGRATNRIYPQIRANIARTEAESKHGWFLEVMPAKPGHGRVLNGRDVCPHHAPVYRTMLAATLKRRSKLAGNDETP